jgi:hypothetical protein
MIDERTPPKRALSFNYTTAAIAAIIVIAAVTIGFTVTSSTSPSVLSASYRCVPPSQIAQLKPGQSGTLTTTDGSFTATFRSTEPVRTPAKGLEVGMPFKGALTMTGGGKTWTLPRPDDPSTDQVNVVCVIAFQRETYPGVMVEGYTGGAHCCYVPVIYLFDRARNRYVKVVDMSPKNYQDPHAFDPNSGFFPKVVGSHVLLQSDDGQFDYAFACYACEVTPIVLDSVGADGLTDVTGQHPPLVAAAARVAWKYALQALKAEGPTNQIPPAFGYLAPWVADECTLGRGAAAWSEIEQLQRAGKLSNALYHEYATNHGSFVANLHSFLLRDDYCTGQI